jgi:hypothetical protein
VHPPFFLQIWPGMGLLCPWKALTSFFISLGLHLSNFFDVTYFAF